MMNRREFLSCAVMGGLAATVMPRCLAGHAASPSKSKPNVIVLLADDLGYNDLSCFGSKDIQTPHIDALAKEGRLYQRFYSASAVCTPTRASLLSGRYPLRFDIREHYKCDPRIPEFLPANTQTLAKVLKAHGYATAHVGKWHLGGLVVSQIKARAAGDKTIPGPLEHGFEHYLAMREDDTRARLVNERRMYRQGGEYLFRNEQPAEPMEGFLTDIQTNEALSLIDRYHQQRRPFFINLWFDAPHTPYEPAPPPHLTRYETAAKGDTLLYRSMVSNLDANIGRVADKLKALGIFENTLIVFTSDNGPSHQGSPAPWKGGKADLHEGGIRVPMFAVWPEHIPQGTISDEFAHTNDILPTVCAATDIKLPVDVKSDGVSILDNLTGNEPVKRQWPVFWQMNLYMWYPQPGTKPKPFATEVARDKNWKMLAYQGKAVSLFDLQKDPKETTNLIERHPEIVSRLETQLNQWLKEPRYSYIDDLRKDGKGK